MRKGSRRWTDGVYSLPLGSPAQDQRTKPPWPPLAVFPGTCGSCWIFSKDVQDHPNCPGEAHSSPLCCRGDCGVPSMVGGNHGGKEATHQDLLACICSGSPTVLVHSDLLGSTSLARMEVCSQLSGRESRPRVLSTAHNYTHNRL